MYSKCRNHAGLEWELAITLVSDRNCRYNNEHGSKGNRCRTDNMTVSGDGKELDIFKFYFDSREYRSIEDTVVDRIEADRLRGVAYEKLNDRNRKIMDGIIADKLPNTEPDAIRQRGSPLGSY